MKLKRCDGKIRSLCVEKFSCDEKVESFKKYFGTKHGVHVELSSVSFPSHSSGAAAARVMLMPRDGANTAKAKPRSRLINSAVQARGKNHQNYRYLVTSLVARRRLKARRCDGVRVSFLSLGPAWPRTSYVSRRTTQCSRKKASASAGPKCKTCFRCAIIRHAVRYKQRIPCTEVICCCIAWTIC